MPAEPTPGTSGMTNQPQKPAATATATATGPGITAAPPASGYDNLMEIINRARETQPEPVPEPQEQDEVQQDVDVTEETPSTPSKSTPGRNRRDKKLPHEKARVRKVNLQIYELFTNYVSSRLARSRSRPPRTQRS